MPYPTPQSVPSYVPAASRKQWMHVWNSEYQAHGDEGRAFASANSVAGPHKTTHEMHVKRAKSGGYVVSHDGQDHVAKDKQALHKHLKKLA